MNAALHINAGLCAAQTGVWAQGLSSGLAPRLPLQRMAKDAGSSARTGAGQGPLMATTRVLVARGTSNISPEPDQLGGSGDGGSQGHAGGSSGNGGSSGGSPGGSDGSDSPDMLPVLLAVLLGGAALFQAVHEAYWKKPPQLPNGNGAENGHGQHYRPPTAAPPPPPGTQTPTGPIRIPGPAVAVPIITALVAALSVLVQRQQQRHANGL